MTVGTCRLGSNNLPPAEPTIMWLQYIECSASSNRHLSAQGDQFSSSKNVIVHFYNYVCQRQGFSDMEKFFGSTPRVVLVMPKRKITSAKLMNETKGSSSNHLPTF